MSDYQIVRQLLIKEKNRRAAFYRFRPNERAGAMKEIGDALAALERLKKSADWKGVVNFWQDKFDG